LANNNNEDIGEDYKIKAVGMITIKEKEEE